MSDETTRLSRAAIFLDQRLTGAEAGIAISIMRDFAESELDLAEQQGGVCNWRFTSDDREGDQYHPECAEHPFCFTEGGIEENSFKFCPHCGKTIHTPAEQPEGGE